MKANRSMIADFLKTAMSNGVQYVWIAVPSNDPLLRTAGCCVRQIRKIKDVVAEYHDELGNRVVLTTAGFVKQI